MSNSKMIVIPDVFLEDGIYICRLVLIPLIVSVGIFLFPLKGDPFTVPRPWTILGDYLFGKVLHVPRKLPERSHVTQQMG